MRRSPVPWQRRNAFVLAAALAAAPAVPARGVDWPDYRGPTWDGHVPAGDLPLEWSETRNVAWKTTLRGRGWSTPVIADGRIWLTTATEDGRQRFVVAIDQASGAVLHHRKLFDVETPPQIHRLNSYASPSPTLRGDRVFVHFGSDGTACLDTSTAETVWERRDLVIDHIVGAGSSPVLWDDLLIFHQDGGDQQYVIALDAETGETAWKAARSTDYGTLSPDQRKAYDTPYLIHAGDEPRLVSVGAEATIAYQPRTGREIWKVRHPGYSMAARPVAGHGLVFLMTGFDVASLLAVRGDGAGDVTDTHVVWRHDKNVPKSPSPILVGDELYFASEGGILTCLDARTGKPRYRERLGGEFWASPIALGERIYLFDSEGRSYVIAAGPEFRLLATNELDDGLMASPAVAGSALYLRTGPALYRIETLADGG